MPDGLKGPYKYTGQEREWERLTEQEYMAGLRAILNYLQTTPDFINQAKKANITASQLATQYIDAALRRMATEGVHSGLPLYQQAKARALTPELRRKKYEATTQPAYMEQARIGQAQAEMATKRQQADVDWQRQLASMRGEQAAQTWIGGQGQVPETPQVWERPGFRELWESPYISEGARASIEPRLTSGQPGGQAIAWQELAYAQRVGQALEARQVAKIFPEEWKAYQQNPVSVGLRKWSQQPRMEIESRWAQTPEYKRLWSSLYPSSEQIATRQYGLQQKEQKQKETRQEEMWHRPARWAVPRQSA